jgi:hypothetical protein
MTINVENLRVADPDLARDLKRKLRGARTDFDPGQVARGSERHDPGVQDTERILLGFNLPGTHQVPDQRLRWKKRAVH